jgi:hypothetical protein
VTVENFVRVAIEDYEDALFNFVVLKCDHRFYLYHMV